jgi:hypothetical protein
MADAIQVLLTSVGPITREEFATEFLRLYVSNTDLLSMTVSNKTHTTQGVILAPWYAWLNSPSIFGNQNGTGGGWKSTQFPLSGNGSGAISLPPGQFISSVGVRQDPQLPLIFFNAVPGTYRTGGVTAPSTGSGDVIVRLTDLSPDIVIAVGMLDASNNQYRITAVTSGTATIFLERLVPSAQQMSEVTGQRSSLRTFALPLVSTAPPVASNLKAVAVLFSPQVLDVSFEFDISSRVDDIQVLIRGVEVPVRKKSSRSLDLLGQYQGDVTVQYRKPLARVYVNGIVQSESLYAVVGDSVVFVTPPPAGAVIDIGLDFLSERVTFEIQGESLRDLKKLTYLYLSLALPEEVGSSGNMDIEYWIDGDRQRGVFLPNIYRHPELTWGQVLWNGSYPTTREDTRAKLPVRGLFHYMKIRFRSKGPGMMSLNGWELKARQLGQKAK